MSAGIAEAPAIGIGKLLTESGFSVPTHQGNFRWKEDEVKQLFDDITDAIKRGDHTYYLGLMVFMKSDSEDLIVLDGQQRLATSMMILSAIRGWYEQYTEYKESARQIEEYYIGKKDFGETEIQPRLKLNVANNDAFEKYVVKQKPTEEIRGAFNGFKKYDPNKLLLEAALYCHIRIGEIVKAAGDSSAANLEFVAFVKYLRDRVVISRLVVSDESNAYMIFETLNDRGLELSPLDLVKNYLFGRAASTGASADTNVKLRAMESRWVQMIQTLSNVKSAGFLKAYWTSRHGRVQTSNLFENLKREYRNAEKVIELSTDMLSVSEQYAALESGDDPIWSHYDRDVRDTIRSMKVLGAEQAHPVILGGLARFDQREFERLVRLLEVLIVRFQLIGGGRTGRLEFACAKLAHQIYSRDVTTASKAFQEVREIYPSDQEFLEKFAEKEEGTNAKASYLLKRVEKEARRVEKGANAKELEPSTSLTVEHILPKNPTEEWKANFESEEEVEEAINRLGNLCLVARNKELGRIPFEEKKSIFSTSDLVLTKAIASISGPWNTKSITSRQSELAKHAVNAWRFQ